jgi:hypothetical protein
VNRPNSQRVDSRGRLDVLAYRLAERHVLPMIEARTGISGLAEQLKPYLEAFIADCIPQKSILPLPPKPRRKLC